MGYIPRFLTFTLQKDVAGMAERDKFVFLF